MDSAVRAFLEGQGIDPDQATEDQIIEANVFTAAGFTTRPTPPEPTAEAEVETDAETDVETGVPVAATRTVTVDSSQWEQTQATLASLSADRRSRERAELDREVDTAIQDGRITAASRDSWRQAIDPGDTPDEAARTRAAAERQSLAGLAKNRVPVLPSRAAAATETAGSDALLAATLKRHGIQEA